MVCIYIYTSCLVWIWMACHGSEGLEVKGCCCAFCITLCHIDMLYISTNTCNYLCLQLTEFNHIVKREINVCYYLVCHCHCECKESFLIYIVKTLTGCSLQVWSSIYLFPLSRRIMRLIIVARSRTVITVQRTCIMIMT